MRKVGTTRTTNDRSESDQTHHERPAVERAVEADIHHLDAGERERRGERGDGDSGLGRGEHDQRPSHAIGQPPGRGAAERQAGHEGGEDRARRMDGDAEDERQEPHPEHLVDEGAEAGEKEEQEKRWQPHSGGGFVPLGAFRES